MTAVGNVSVALDGWPELIYVEPTRPGGCGGVMMRLAVPGGPDPISTMNWRQRALLRGMAVQVLASLDRVEATS